MWHNIFLKIFKKFHIYSIDLQQLKIGETDHLNPLVQHKIPVLF